MMIPIVIDVQNAEVMKMTIDEAIAKFEKEAQDREWRFKRGKFIDDVTRQKCNIKANEYRQLAEWLRELKQLREDVKAWNSRIEYP